MYNLSYAVGNEAPVGVIWKRRTINSIDFVGFNQMSPTNTLRSIKSAVLLESSITTWKAYNPLLCCTLSRYGLTIDKNLFLV